MENYNWDKRDIVRRRKKIRSLLLKTNLSKNERMLLEYYNTCADEMLWALANRRIDVSKIATISMPLHKKINYFYNLIDSYSTSYQNDIILDSYSVFREHEYKYSDDVLGKSLSFGEQKELLEILYSFNSKSKDMFNKMINPKNHLLNFNTKGQSCFFPFDDKNYITLDHKDNLESYLCFAHELGHNYESVVDKNDIPKLNDKYVPYFEMYSLFFEHISIDNLLKEGIINDTDRKNIMNHLKSTNIQGIELYITLLMADGDKFDFREKLYIKGETKAPTSISQYYYSYIIAINMYYKYLKDPEYTLYLMEYLCNNFNEDEEESMLEYCDIDLSNNIIIKHLEDIKTKNN